MSEASRRRWESVLERLELDLVRAEGTLSDSNPPDPEPSTEPWAEPWAESHAAPPIPADLLPRAQALLSRQREVCDRLAAAASSVRRQEALAARMGRAVAPPSVYLDVDA